MLVSLEKLEEGENNRNQSPAHPLMLRSVTISPRKASTSDLLRDVSGEVLSNVTAEALALRQTGQEF
jgi:hypothetical protein